MSRRAHKVDLSALAKLPEKDAGAPEFLAS